MPSLKTPDGAPVELDADAVNAQFDAAMNSDPGDDAPKDAPPKRQPKAAPVDEEKPRTRRARQPKAEKARTTKAAAPVKDDYTDDAQALVTTAWSVAAALPPAQPYAWALSQSADALIPALADGAKHSAFVRSIVSGGGANSWQIKLAAAGMQFGMNVLAIMRDPQLRADAAAATRAQLAEALKANGITLDTPSPAPAAA